VIPYTWVDPFHGGKALSLAKTLGNQALYLTTPAKTVEEMSN
jgi:hypothetical protein